MSRLVISVPVPQVPTPLSGLAQLVSGLITMLDFLAEFLAEAERLAWQARQRYPFAD